MKNLDTKKIQLRAAINFISSNGTNGKCVMHLRTDIIEILIGKGTYKVMKEPFWIFFFFFLDIK